MIHTNSNGANNVEEPLMIKPIASISLQTTGTSCCCLETPS